MFGPKFVLSTLCISLMLTLGDSIKCFQCNQKFVPSILRENNNTTVSNEYPECQGSQNTWHTWECQEEQAVCMIMGEMTNHGFDIIRMCASEGFCSSHKAPQGVTIDFCHECTSNYCNYERPPSTATPAPRLTLDVNLNLNIKNIPCMNCDKNKTN